MNPALKQEFHFFCEQEQLQKHATLDKNPYRVYGPLKHLLSFDLFIYFSYRSPTLSKYKVSNKTVKILFSVRSAQEAKPTMTFHIMWTEFVAFSPLGEKTTIILIHWRERK